ncbi:TRAP transporter small permease subunit [Aquimarina sp. W85]|uniref:TRAP transporter small permease subunit n=1 Tax=Aquimarina rhodophyticola TaxID=3342246 RepID=UPI00366D4D07
MDAVIKILDWINEKVGKVVSWLSVLMIVVISTDVFIRYVFEFTYIWIVEIEIYLFGLVFLLASGYTFKHEKHVRVDVFYAKLSDKSKAWIDLMGAIIFLLPWCLIIIMASWRYGYSSFLMGENSAQPGGLPALYLLKFSITLGFVFLLLQGISHCLKSIRTILNKV